MFYPVYALLKGELFPGPGHVSLLGAWQFQLADRGGSGWILTPGSPSNELLHVVALLRPGPAAGRRGRDGDRPVRDGGSGFLPWPPRCFCSDGAAAVGYLPAMYVIQLLPFLAILLAGVTEVAVGAVVRLGPREDPIAHRLRGAVLVAGAVLAGAALRAAVVR